MRDKWPKLWRRPLGVVLALTLMASACGGDSDTRTDDSDTTTSTEATASGELVIAGYGGVTAPLLEDIILAPFTEDTGVEVTVQIVPGEQVAGIFAQNEAGNILWDMTLHMADTDAAALLAEGYLATMPDDLLAKIREQIPATQPYGIPSRFGAVQIICNANLVDPCPENAEELFDTDNFPGPRIFPSFQPLVLIALALAAEGVPAEEMFPEDLEGSLENVELAIETLEEFKPSILTFYSSSTEAAELLNRGEAVLGGLWAGSALEIEPSDQLDLVTTWNDAVKYSQLDVVYKGAPNEDNAWLLIEWISEHPEVVAEYVAANPAGTAYPQAFEALPEEVQEQLPPAESDPPLPSTDAIWYSQYPEVKERIDEFWSDYTQG